MLIPTPVVDLAKPKEQRIEPEPETPERSEEERLAWYREGIESLREYRRTGLHVTWEEMEAWMKTWGSKEKTEPPECHT